MKMKWAGLSVFVILVFLLAACAPQATATPVMEDETMSQEDEMMEEDEAMEEEGDMEESDEDMDDEMMDEEMALTTFVVRIENTGAAEGLTVLAPGAYELNDHPVSFFTPGEKDRGEGLEALAEDGDPSILVGMINQMMADMDDDMEDSMDEGMMSFVSNVFNTPVGADAPGPAGPGAAYEFSITAYPGQYLTFATMFVHSNDWFFAPDQDGIALFDADGWHSAAISQSRSICGTPAPRSIKPRVRALTSPPARPAPIPVKPRTAWSNW